MFRKDVPLFQIVDLAEFDREGKISQHIEGEFTFKPWDYVEWEAGSQYHGFADVVSAVEPPRNGYTYVTLQKRS